MGWCREDIRAKRIPVIRCIKRGKKGAIAQAGERTGFLT